MTQPELMGTVERPRRVLLSMPMQLPAPEAAKRLTEFLASYAGDASELMFGCWDYGEELVVTAPEAAR
jgi:hypothetical protein